ncbi:MAG: hypothetical protein B7Z57_11585 [Acidiphilium sp. 37-60-79]|nr:MAG: hypothetical protein B7Z57_11585 [Acidiphilium sp. 37-60-79]OZB40855.1 MAG: hypothetical protein B7X48_03250 [Acidiphilium sp. 34-60-192]
MTGNLTSSLTVSAIGGAFLLGTNSDAQINGYLVGVSISNVTLELSPVSGTLSGGSAVGTISAAGLGGISVVADVPMSLAGYFHPAALFETSGTPASFISSSTVDVRNGPLIELDGSLVGAASFMTTLGEVGTVNFGVLSAPTQQATLGINFSGLAVTDGVLVASGVTAATDNLTFTTEGAGHLGLFSYHPAAGSYAAYLTTYVSAPIVVSAGGPAAQTITLESDIGELLNLDGVDVRPGYFSGVQIG